MRRNRWKGGRISDWHFTEKERREFHYADIRATLEAAGDKIGPLDLLIAAQSRSLDATIVTANAREFERVQGLDVMVWENR